MKPTFNWGWGILIFFCSFVAFMIFMVYLTSTVDHDLVTTDYYRQEIEYQDKIDMKNNLAKTGMHVGVKNEGGEILVQVPAVNNAPVEKAQVYFYRPSDESRDIKLNQHQNGVFSVPAGQLVKGVYVIQTEWICSGKKYYEEINYTMP